VRGGREQGVRPARTGPTLTVSILCFLLLVVLLLMPADSENMKQEGKQRKHNSWH